MSQNGGQDQSHLPPNLANILATLSSFTGAQNNGTQAPQSENNSCYPPSTSAFGFTGVSQAHQPPNACSATQSYAPAHGYGYTGYDATQLPQSHGTLTQVDRQPTTIDRTFTPPQVPWDAYPPPPPARTPQQPPLEPERKNKRPLNPSRPAFVPAQTQTGPGFQSTTNTSDASTIITWSAAVRHVTRLAAKHQELEERIAKMIKIQHQHEHQWFESREALQRKQDDRVEGQRKIEETLRAINMPTLQNHQTPEDIDRENAKEMNIFDRKVHRAAATMTKDMSRELAALGIPFFDTDIIHIIDPMRDNGVESHAEKSPNGKAQSDAPPQSAKTISRSELGILQKKMIQHLEDLYGDDEG